MLFIKNSVKRNLLLDVFELNETSNHMPAVILIHGGGWRSGNKKMMHPLAVKLAEKNYITFTIEYRLSPEAEYPAAVYDLKDAIKWIKINSYEYKIDTNKIAVLGCSAGGTLAVLLGATNDNKKFEDSNGIKKTSSKINAIVDVDGILDFTHPAESGKDLNPEKPSAGKLWFGASYLENPEIWIEASPINYIDENTPPVLFINSSEERFHAGKDKAIEKLNNFNIYFEMHEIKDSPHTFRLFHPWFDETVKTLNDFLNKIFK